MSRRRGLAVLTAAVVLLPGLAHAGSPGPAGRVSVVYEHPEQFTDVKDTAAGLTRGRDAYLAALAGWLERRTARRVPADHALAIAITDVDRAGDFEPARGPSFTSVRIVRELYAPRITLRFTLTDGTGTVVREGERTLGDPMFLTRATLDQHGPLRHETALLETWLDREFAGAR
jgi:hypothetical protein